MCTDDHAQKKKDALLKLRNELECELKSIDSKKEELENEKYLAGARRCVFGVLKLQNENNKELIGEISDMYEEASQEYDEKEKAFNDYKKDIKKRSSYLEMQIRVIDAIKR